MENKFTQEWDKKNEELCLKMSKYRAKLKSNLNLDFDKDRYNSTMLLNKKVHNKFRNQIRLQLMSLIDLKLCEQ